jgi:hypothetical protein
MKKTLPQKPELRKSFVLLLLLSMMTIKLNAAYYWQVQSIISFTGSATYALNAPANPLVLSIQQCAGGISQPHNSTTYVQTLYVNTLNSTVGGTVVSSNVINTPWVFPPTYSYTPSTATAGTLYYYYVLTAPSMTTCGFTGTLTSAIATVAVAGPGESLHFDGANDYVNLGNGINSIIDPINKFTAEAWVLPSSTVSPTFDAIVGNYNTSTGGMQFLLRQSGNKYEFWVDAGAGFVSVGSAPGTVSLSVWQHVAGTWDGSLLKLYLNGALSATSTAIGSSFITHSNPVWIGGQSTNSEYFEGRIDEVKLWSRALCQGEIQNNMTGMIPTSATGLIANYHFNQGLDAQPNPTVTTLIDASGNAYTGTLTNMALTGSTSNWISPGAVTGSVTPFSGPTISVNSGSVCPGNPFIITPSGATSYTIQGGTFTVTPTVNTSYTVIGSTAGCLSSNTATSNITMGTCALAEALNFDGSNDYVSIPKSISSDFTIEYWMKTTQTGQTGPQWYFGNGIVDAEVGGVTNDFGTALVGTKLAFGIGNPDVSIFSTSNVNTGNWTHVAATWKQTTGTMNLYINGVLESSGTSGTALRNSPPDIKLGVLGTLLRYLNVNIDDLRLWNTVRTACEINTYKNCEIPTNASGLIANYHFNQGYDANPNPGVTALNDISGNTNNGTLFNFALTGTGSNWVAPGGVVTGSTTPLPPPVVGSSVTNSIICMGNSTTLNGTGASTYTWTGGVSDGVAFSPTTTASYTVTGTASTGCTNTAVNSVTVNSLPSVSVNSGSICSGSSFTMSPAGASTYTFSSGTAIVSPTSTATYTVSGTDLNGCTGTAMSNVTVNICAGAEALNFDGIDDHVNLGTGINAALSSLNKITVEAWVKPSTTAGPFRIIVGNYSTPANQMQFCLRQQNTGYVFFIGNGSLGNYLSVLAANTVTTGVWQHVAGTWDGSVVSIYVNGVLSNTASVTYPNFGTTTNSVIIGINSVPEQWSGDIDEVRIWDRVVCEGEILNNMNGEIPTNSTGLIANYHFDQGVAGQPNPTVTMLNDASSSAYTGTLTGMSLTGTTSNWITPGAVTGNVTPFVSPTIAVTGNNSVCSGNSATLTANGNVTSYSWVSGPATASNVVTPTATTSYSVSGMNLGCPSNMVVHTVTFNNLPTVSASTSASLICSQPVQQTAILTAGGANTYTWNTSVIGSSVSVSPSVTTSYTVTGTDANGCENTAIITQSVSNCAGITGYTVNPGLTVYPNPNNGILIVDVPEYNMNTAVTISNVLGQLVLTEQISQEKTQISIQNLENGIYFVELNHNNIKQSIKIIKQ